MRILVAFSNYKNSLSAIDACEATSAFLSEKGFLLDSAPLTDGGEGFCEILSKQLQGSLESITVKGPTFKPLSAHIGWADLDNLTAKAKSLLNLPNLSGKLAIIEMAEASGYECIPDSERNAWNTSSIGTGQLIQVATDKGAKAILLGIGGSATNDCGAGALEALGVVYYDSLLQPVEDITPAKWKKITSLGGSLHVGTQFPPIRIACDVENPLLGSHGATAVYGSQKGILDTDIDHLDRLMKKMANRFLGLFGKDPETWDQWHKIKGSGAAGGIGFGLKAALKNVEFVEGFALCSELIQLDQKIARSDIVFTGEGRLDSSSLSGKGPYSLLSKIKKNQKAILFSGSADMATKKLIESKYDHVTVVELKEPQWDLATSLENTKQQILKKADKVVSAFL